MKRRETACLRGKLRRQKHGGIFIKKMTKRIALALSMVLFALAFTACGPNLFSGGDGGSKDTEGGIGDTLSNMFFDYTVLEATSPAEYDGYTAAEGNRLIVCSVKVKNTFGETIPMYDSDFQLQWGNIGGDDDDYTFSLDAFNDTMMPLEYELADGEEVTYDLVFEAPADVKDFGLVYLEEYYTGSESESGTGDFFSVNFTVE